MQLEVGSIIEGKITGITKFGAFVDLGEGKTGMVHISEIASTYVKEITDHIAENQQIKVKVLNITPDGKVGLSIKKAQDTPPPSPQGGGDAHFAPPVRRGRPFAKPPLANSFDTAQRRTSEPQTFEDMMSKFKQASDDKMSDLKRSMDVKRGASNRKTPSR